MSEQTVERNVDRINRGKDAQGSGAEPLTMLEGMRVLFDERVGLHPVTLISRRGEQTR